MTAFSKDRDLLKYEAGIFGDLHFGWQVLCTGEGGVLEGAVFSKAGVDFAAAGVGAGGVIYLWGGDGPAAGVYEIVSVESVGQLMVSVLRGDESAEAVAPPVGGALGYRVSTFEPQAIQVGLELTEYLGIRPGRPESEYGADQIADTVMLRRASAFGVLAAVYATLADGTPGGEGFWRKSRHYGQLYEQARQRCRVSVDAGVDGGAERRIVGGSARLTRE